MQLFTANSPLCGPKLIADCRLILVRSMPRALLTTALLLTGAVVASARVGETVGEIETRYGKHTGVVWDYDAHWIKKDELGNEMRSYSFHGFTIIVTFVDGKSATELFKKCKEDVPCDKAWDTMSEGEVEAILKPYDALGVKWKAEEWAAKAHRRPLWWASEDGKLKAINMMNMLLIGRTDYMLDLDAKRKENEKKRLSGF
jgi:hypothetical protein